MKIIMAMVGAAVTAVAFGAAEADADSAGGEESTKFISAGFDVDYFTAYVWHNALSNDRQVMQPCVWADLVYFNPFYIGGYVWQNYDLTDRRRGSNGAFEHGLSENDYNVHIGGAVWSSDDAEHALTLELGHDWYCNSRLRDGCSQWYPDTREIYVKSTYANPFVNVYGQVSWMYDDFGEYDQAMYYELGVNREYELYESVMLGVDWNLGFGDSDYLHFLYGSDSNGGIGGTTVKLYLAWSITDWMALQGTIAYTGALDEDARDEMSGTDRDTLWGGLSLKFEY